MNERLKFREKNKGMMMLVDRDLLLEVALNKTPADFSKIYKFKGKSKSTSKKNQR